MEVISENFPNLADTLRMLQGLQESLIGTLEQEREALRNRSFELLGKATEQKLAVCQQIEASLQALPAPVADLIDGAPEDSQPELELHHTRLCELAREAKDLNAVNGKIISRSQQSVRELIGALNGHDAHALYGAQGTSARGHAANGPAIANV